MGGEMRGGWADGWVNERMAEITKICFEIYPCFYFHSHILNVNFTAGKYSGTILALTKTGMQQLNKTSAPRSKW